jgi:uncharacterized protein
MIYLLDSNILLYAHRTKMPQHQKISAWLIEAITAGDTILLTESVLLSFIRIGTNPKIFNPPLTMPECEQIIGNLLAQPNVMIHSPLAGHYTNLTRFMTKHNLADKMTMDAHLACIALAAKAIVVTNDKGFKKFQYVKTLNPLRN